MQTFGADLYNATLTGCAAKTLNSAATDSDHIPVAVIDARADVMSVGFKAGQSANGGLGIEDEVAQTMQSRMSALEPTVLVIRSDGSVPKFILGGGNVRI